MAECTCLECEDRNNQGSLERFSVVRAGCPVLHEILVPNNVWEEFHRWHSQPDTEAFHRSILLLAMQRGYLSHITSAVHRYLIVNGQSRSNISPQYRQDLRERWMFYSDPIKRHKKYRMFRGKLVELQFAEWLESNGYRVCGMEAVREGPDIEAQSDDGRCTAFEVKFIGTQDDDFGIILKSLVSQPVATSVSPYDAANYLLFRVYEAAKQLQRSFRDRIAVMVVEDLTWDRFSMQLGDSWIDWAHPQFFRGHDWGRCVEKQLTRYPNLLNDLQPSLQSLRAIWIMRLSEGYQYHRKVVVLLRSM